MESNPEITRLIRAWQYGDRAAEHELFEALYRTLHGIAANCLRTEREGGSLGPTGLVHEAYLRFPHIGDLPVSDRSHFLALIARVMRRIIVDRARARSSQKRGGDNHSIEVDDALIGASPDADQVLMIDLALTRLHSESPRQAKLVELRYFGGFSIEESAAILEISTRTARRDWRVARLRLKLAIDGAESS